MGVLVLPNFVIYVRNSRRTYLSTDLCEQSSLTEDSFSRYLESLLTELDRAQRKLKRKGIKQFLKTMKISDAIDGYKQRMNTIKEDYVVSACSLTRRY